MRRVATTAAGVLALDALSKALALRWLEGRVVQLGNLVELRLTRNTGMALGLGADSRLALLLPPLVVLAGAWLLRRYRLTAFTQTACGLVLGGFLGNFLNRLVSGHVLDMVQFPFLPWFVCNVADIAISIGVTLMGISLLFRPQDWEERSCRR